MLVEAKWTKIDFVMNYKTDFVVNYLQCLLQRCQKKVFLPWAYVRKQSYKEESCCYRHGVTKFNRDSVLIFDYWMLPWVSLEAVRVTLFGLIWRLINSFTRGLGANDFGLVFLQFAEKDPKCKVRGPQSTVDTIRYSTWNLVIKGTGTFFKKSIQKMMN